MSSAHRNYLKSCSDRAHLMTFTAAEKKRLAISIFVGLLRSEYMVSAFKRGIVLF